MAHFVEVKWDGRDRDKTTRGVRYISHREEGLEGGATRVLYGIGDRYRALRGDEPAIARQLFDDGDGLREARYYRGKLTVDDDTAQRLARLSPEQQERALRDAVEKTFAGVMRRAQGVFVIHMHGGRGRPHGHPHAHIRLSPVLDDGRRMVITPHRLARFKERWTAEVDRAVERALKRADGRERAGSRASRPEAPGRERSSASRAPAPRRKSVAARVLSVLGMGAKRATVRRLAPGLADAQRAQEQVAAAIRNPGAALTRAAFNLATRSLPAPLRAGIGAARLLGRLRGGDR